VSEERPEAPVRAAASAPRSTVRRLAALNADLLERVRKLVSGVDEELFAFQPPEANGGVGTQLRHCTDYYECFLRDLPGGRIDYDRRRRDPRIECDPQRACEQLEALGRALRALDGDPELPLRVRVDEPLGEEPGAAERGWTGSTLARELRFLTSHTIHHFAMMALVLRLRGHAVEADFGVAPPTLEYWERRGGPPR
jgi:uncharacterized damage-inducible protein DinB